MLSVIDYQMSGRLFSLFIVHLSGEHRREKIGGQVIALGGSTFPQFLVGDNDDQLIKILNRASLDQQCRFTNDDLVALGFGGLCQAIELAPDQRVQVGLEFLAFLRILERQCADDANWREAVAGDDAEERRERPGEGAGRTCERVQIVFPPFDYVNRPKPRSGLDGKFSVQYTTLVALLDGEVTVDSFTNERLNSPDVQALLPKVEFSVDKSIPFDKLKMHVIVNVWRKDGKQLSERVDKLLG